MEVLCEAEQCSYICLYMLIEAEDTWFYVPCGGL